MDHPPAPSFSLRRLLLPYLLLAVLQASAQSVSLAPKVLLDGPYEEGTGLMRDDLRSQGLIPLQEPYSGIGTLLGGAGGETTTGAVLSTTGNNAIVDWVLVELRSAASIGMVVFSQCALVQRDGDIVGTDGTSALSFPVAPGAYHVAVRHRNHLAVMTEVPVTLSGSPLNLDFRNPATATYGIDARKLLGGVALLWAGDANADGQIRYTGSGNDRDPILSAIGGVFTAVLNGVYMLEDVNMDGTVKYVGLNNDRDVILVTIGGLLPTASIAQQAPDDLSTPGAGVTDIDGNTYATIVLSNGQEWMAENLRTAIYANGTPIPNVTDNTAWTQLTSGAWSHYDNNPGYDATYGKLYNWYAAANPNLCPQGWHVPTDGEWQQLESALGMPGGVLGQTGSRGDAQNVGGVMKAVSPLWNAPNTGATNESGFSGLPGGYRNNYFGNFLNLGGSGNWWSASESGAEIAWRRVLSNSNAGVFRNSNNKRNGFCLRCVRD